MNRLLTKPLKAFTWYALVVLLVSVPVYALVVDFIWIIELDENNWLILQHTRQKLESKAFNAQEMDQISNVWSELIPGVSIQKAEMAKMVQDSVYEVIRPNPYDEDDGEDRFRGLSSSVDIDGQLYRLTVETNVEESDETFAAVALVTLVFFVVLIFGFILLNRRIAKSTWKPFEAILKSLRSFELSRDEQVQLPQTDILEFEELNASLRELIQGTIRTYQQQKAFTENASHELQTPIAVLKSKLDVLMQQPELTPKLSALVNDLATPLSRLTRINKNLLLLAKVENKQYADLAPQNVQDYLHTALALFEDYIQSKSLTITNLCEDLLPVQANAFLMETLVHNLLSNAIKHTRDGGELILESEPRALTIRNSGNEPLKLDRLFERFTSVTNDQVSSGLGLSIIQEIVHRYGWSIRYDFLENKHVFKVDFLN